MASPFSNHELRKEFVNCVEDIIKEGRAGKLVVGQTFIPNKHSRAWAEYNGDIQGFFRTFGFTVEEQQDDRFFLVAI